MAVTIFNLAVDRAPVKGQEKQTDFPRVKVFGKTAETCSRYLAKGMKVMVIASIQTGSFQNRQGKTIYTTDIVANRIEFMSSSADKQVAAKEQHEEKTIPRPESKDQPVQGNLFDDFPGEFEQIEQDLPF